MCPHKSNYKTVCVWVYVCVCVCGCMCVCVFCVCVCLRVLDCKQKTLELQDWKALVKRDDSIIILQVTAQQQNCQSIEIV